MKQLLDECLSELGLALERFGTYTFDDKGAHEVMDVDVLAEKFRKLTPEDAATVLLALSKSKNHDGRGVGLASDLICNMQDWDELFAVDGFDELEW